MQPPHLHLKEQVHLYLRSLQAGRKVPVERKAPAQPLRRTLPVPLVHITLVQSPSPQQALNNLRIVHSRVKEEQGQALRLKEVEGRHLHLDPRNLLPSPTAALLFRSETRTMQTPVLVMEEVTRTSREEQRLFQEAVEKRRIPRRKEVSLESFERLSHSTPYQTLLSRMLWRVVELELCLPEEVQMVYLLECTPRPTRMAPQVLPDPPLLHARQTMELLQCLTLLLELLSHLVDPIDLQSQDQEKEEDQREVFSIESSTLPPITSRSRVQFRVHL